MRDLYLSGAPRVPLFRSALLLLCVTPACGGRLVGWPEDDTASTGDLTLPIVNAVAPRAGELDVARHPTILANFSEPMDAQTLDALTLTTGGMPVPGTAVAFGRDGMVFEPDADLDGSTEYTATVGATVTDRSGNAMAEPFVWSFTTADAGGDVSPPRVVFTDPESAAVDVHFYAGVFATFNEGMDGSTLGAGTFRLQTSDGAEVPGTVSYDAPSQTVELAVDTELDPGSTYTATIAGGVSDTAGNPMGADYTWDFTTAFLDVDTTAPWIVFVDPADGAVEVTPDSGVYATFNEPMDSATVTGSTFVVRDAAGDPVAGNVTYDLAAQTAAFHAGLPFQVASVYTATVYAGAADLAGNSLGGSYSWVFTTRLSTDETASPTVTLTAPTDGAYDVPLSTDIEAAFSEEMDPASVDALTFLLVDGAGVPVAGSVSYDPASHVAVFLPDVELASTTYYTATVTTGVSDLTGDHMVADRTWVFLTEEGPWDLAPLDLRSLSTFVAVAGAGLTNSNSSGSTTLGGDVGLSPLGTCLTDGVPCSSSDPVVTGALYVADATAAQAQADLTSAYTDGMARPPGTLESDLSGLTLPAGVYTSASTMTIAVGGTVTLDGGGDPNAVWIFQIGSSLTVGDGAQVLLVNGAQAANVYWVAFASSTLGSDVRFQGNVLAGASNSIGTDSVVVGRLLCATGTISLLSNAISLPPS